MVSFSSLGVFTECSMKYHHRYTLNTPYETRPEEALVKGSLTHKLLEGKIRGIGVEDTLMLVLGTWVEKELGVVLEEEVLSDLYTLGIGVSNVYERVAEHYQGEDKLRNKDGSVCRDPIGYPSGSIRVALKPYLDDLSRIDLEITRRNGALGKFSIVCTVAQAVAWANLFEVPSWVAETLGLERDLSHGEWVAYCDWDFRTTCGKLVIVDHKTYKKAPREAEIVHNPQLNLYVYLYNEKYGVLPTHIGIHHVCTGSFLIAEVDYGIVKEVVEYYKGLYEETKTKKPVKRHPLEFNSPCVRFDYITNTPSSICPYLQHCWRSYYSDVIVDEHI